MHSGKIAATERHNQPNRKEPYLFIPAKPSYIIPPVPTPIDRPGTMNTTEMGTFRDNQNAAAGHDMALMCEYMAHAMKKSSQQVCVALVARGEGGVPC